MDEVLRAALRLENPEKFLNEPSRAVDWRMEPPRAATETPAATTPPPPGAIVEH
jgi:hypothetical protein